MSDRYTKAVLTIIAAALVAIVVQNATGTLNAQGTMMQICGNDPDTSSGGPSCASVRMLGRSGSGHSIFGLEVTR
jgi:hypothetical protein